MKIYGVTGWKNSGKTGLMERLVAEFTSRGITVSTIKHAHHNTDVDQPGRDSYRHRSAGASEVIVASPNRWALMHELRGAQEPKLEDLIARMSPVDLVLIEGYKRAPHPKVQTHRQEAGHDVLGDKFPAIRAIASDVDIPDAAVPVLHLDDTAAIADFISTELDL